MADQPPGPAWQPPPSQGGGQPTWGQQPPGSGQPGWGRPPTWGQPSGWGQQPAWGPEPAWGQQPGSGPPQRPGSRPRPGIIPLRPITLGEILDGAFQSIRTNPRTMLGVSAVVLIAVTAIGVVPNFYLLLTVRDLGELDPAASDADVQQALTPMLSAVGGLGLITVLKILATTVLSALLVVAVSEAVIGRRTSPSQVWARVRPRLFAVIGLSLLTLIIPMALVLGGISLAVVLGLLIGAQSTTGAGVSAGLLIGLVCVVLAIWIGVRLSLAGPALLLERAGIGLALKRSWRLVGGSWWRVWGVLLVAAIITGIGASIVAGPFSIAQTMALGSDPSVNTSRVFLAAALGGIGEIIGGTVMTPFSAAVTSLLYIDRRMRAEGLDIDLTRAAQGGRPE